MGLCSFCGGCVFFGIKIELLISKQMQTERVVVYETAIQAKSAYGNLANGIRLYSRRL